MQRSSMEIPLQMSDLYMVLLGSTGAGKSASGNTILDRERETFKEGYSAESETTICTPAHKQVDGRTINVIDTVGLSDTKNKDVQTKIEQIFDCTRHGVDVFLLVIKLGVKFTEEVSIAVQWIQDNFGAKVLKHTIVLFTHGDLLRVPIEDYLGECEALRSIVDQCSGGFHIFNNKDKDPSQVTELLEKVKTLRRKNVYRRYTEQDYKETQDKILLKKSATRAAVGGAAAGVAVVGGVLGAAGAAIAARMGAVEFTPGKAAGAGAVAAVVGAGLYFFMRK